MNRAESALEDFDRQATITKFSNLIDDDMYPRMPKALVLDWTLFTRDFWSCDKELTQESREICEQYLEHCLDFRPYLINNPL